MLVGAKFVASAACAGCCTMTGAKMMDNRITSSSGPILIRIITPWWYNSVIADRLRFKSRDS
jgi:hypothetical protein